MAALDTTTVVAFLSRVLTASHRETLRSLAMAWALVLLGAMVLVFSYDSLPDAVMLYRPPWQDAPTMGRTSFVSVGRIALMGVGQLGAATSMAFASRGSESWERFWRWLGLIAGVKTLLECIGLVLPQGGPLERAVMLSTFVVVTVFVLRAAWWWHRRELGAFPSKLIGWPRIGLFASLALWAAFALAPRFLA